MGRRYDDRRWVQNPDGSFSRRESVEGIEHPADGSWSPEITGDGSGEKLPPIEDRYYQDIATTGAAASLADELGVDLSQVEGTGKGGRITKADVEAAAK